MLDYTKEEIVLATALWDSENTNRLGDQPEEDILAMLKKSRIIIEWLETLDHEIKPIDRMEAANDD